jgi:FkbM family methyltransferase
MIGRLFTKYNKFNNDVVVRHDDSAATKDDIYHCFRLILGRDPLAKEWQAHLQASEGRPLIDVVTKYITSLEFFNRNIVKESMDGFQHTVVDVDNFRLYVSPEDKVCGGLIGSGEYEPSVTHHLKKHLSSGKTFLDIGANIGFFTCLAASLTGDDGKVIAVEPFEYNVKLLLANIKLNEFTNVEILPFAFSSTRGVSSYDDSGGNSGFIAGTEDTPADTILRSTLIHTQKMDDALRDENRTIDVVKIDVEGAEYLALSGGIQRLKQDQPVIFSEFSEAFLVGISQVDPVDYLQLLLLDDSYGLSIIQPDNSLYYCGRNTEKLIDYYRGLKGIDHIDLIACCNSMEPEN